MKKFNKNYRVGTKVLLKGFYHKYFEVTEIHETRNWIKLKGLQGSFQTGHIAKYTNQNM